jgi:hypothetical protein
MAFTDVGSSGGVIYDSNEDNRLNDFADNFNAIAERADSEETKKKNLIRYGIIGVGLVLILVVLKTAIKKK